MRARSALLASLVEALFILPSHVADFARPIQSRGKPRMADGWL